MKNMRMFPARFLAAMIAVLLNKQHLSFDRTIPTLAGF